MIRFSSLFLVLASGCQCDIPFSETMTLTLETAVGGSANCATREEDEIDENGDVVSTGDYGEVHYNYAHDGSVEPPPVDPTDPTAPTQCTIHVVNWLGDLADLKKIKEDVDTSVKEQGLDPEKADVTIDNVGFGDVSVAVKTAAGADFPLDNVGPFNAHLNVMGEDDEVLDVVVIDNPGTGQVQAGHITTTDKGAELAAIFTAAFNQGEAIVGTGQSDVQFVFGDLGELTNDDQGAPILTITVDVKIDGTLTAGL